MKKNIKRLYRSEEDVMIGGVCGGISDYFEVDPVLIRVIAVIFGLCAFSGVLAYVLLWIIVPLKSKLQNKK